MRLGKTPVNSIRPFVLASLLVTGEAQVTIRPTGTGACRFTERPRAVSPGTENQIKSGKGERWLEAEWSEGCKQ